MTEADLDLLLASSRCFGGSTVFGWTLDISLTGPLLILIILYGVGLSKIWRRVGRGRHIFRYRTVLFAAGWLAIVVALLSPLHEASRALFTAHMIEHEILMIVAAPLLVLAQPLPVLLWALPVNWRKGIGKILRYSWFARSWQLLTAPLVATLLHGLAIWVWHIPYLFQAALLHQPVHWAQHFSFIGSALLFWSALLLYPQSVRRGLAIGHLFATAGHTGLLGILITLSPRLWFPLQMTNAKVWHLTRLQDQQLAGLVMWIPSGTIYAGTALALMGLWIHSSADSSVVPGPPRRLYSGLN